jgi:hypothetical protein
MRISATCDANPNAVSGVALDATPDANLVATLSATSSAVYAANQLPVFIRLDVRRLVRCNVLF